MLAAEVSFWLAGVSMYTYSVMPSGPVNGPVMFIRMMCNINGKWQVMAIDNGVTIDNDTNTKISVDNSFNYAISEDQVILYMEAQFTTAALCRLSFSLPKSLSFPNLVEFVSISIGIEFNMPAASKFELLHTWLKALDL